MADRPMTRQAVLVLTVLGAGIMLTVGGCSHLTPLGPDPAASMPTPHPLRSPLALQAVRVQQPLPAGGCPSGYVTLLGGPGGGGPGMCYRMTGTPVTFASAAVSPVAAYQPKPPPGHPAAQLATVYQFTITLPAGDASALTAVTTTAYDAQGALAVTVAGKTWAQGMVVRPFRGRQFQVFLPSRNQALQLQGELAAPGEGGKA